MLRRPFCGMAAGFLLGILMAAYGENRIFLAAIVVLTAARGILYGVCLRYRRRKTDFLPEGERAFGKNARRAGGQRVFRIALCILMFLLGGIRYEKEQEYREGYLPYLEENMQLLVQGKLCRKELKNNQYIYELRSCMVELETDGTSGKVPVSCNRILVYSDSDEASIGEILVVSGTADLWESARNEGNYDEKSYYEARKVDFALKNITLLASYGKGSRWREGAWQLKLRLRAVYQKVMEPEEGGVLAAMALGDKGLLDAEIKRLYQTGGLSHIMAISGLHISVIGMTLYRFLRKRGLGFSAAGLLAGTVMYAYGTMAGMGTPVQRALVMFVLSLGAQALGRGYDTLNALGVAALFLLWDNPYLLWDAGFQFSFAAIIGVAWVGKCASFAETGKAAAEKEKAAAGKGKLAGFLRENRGKLADKLFVCGAIQLTTLPLVAWYYYEIPVYGILMNLVILPMMGILLSLGLVGGFAGLVSEKAAAVLLFPCEKLLAGSNLLCGICGGLPGAMWITGRPGLGRIALYYGLLAGVTWYTYRRKAVRAVQMKEAGGSMRVGATAKVREAQGSVGTGATGAARETGRPRWGFGKAVAIGILLVLILCIPARGGFELDILDVGQGDGSFLKTGQGYTIFVDGGSSNVKSVGTYRILPFLKYKGVRGIDYWLVSHTDEDHISGLKELLEAGYEIRHLVFSSSISQDETLVEILELAERQGTEILYLDAGDVLHLGDAKLVTLFPAEAGSAAGAGTVGSAADTETAGSEAGAETAGSAAAGNVTTVDKNAASLVFWYEEGDFSGIFTGDIGSAEEEKLIDILAEMCQSGKLDGTEVDFYKAAHHGSKYSNSEAFLTALSPRIAVVSCAKKNSYGHPAAEAVAHMEEVGSAVFYTMESGQITVKMEDGVCVYEFVGE